MKKKVNYINSRAQKQCKTANRAYAQQGMNLSIHKPLTQLRDWKPASSKLFGTGQVWLYSLLKKAKVI